jgi:thiamine-phosphate pyrophosphorylase
VSHAIRGLYAITPEEKRTSVLVDKVRRAIAGGARLVQYRNKTADSNLRKEHVQMLLPICRAASTALIINDDVQLALATGADGVHLGREDGDIAAARKQLGPKLLLGASCYDRLELARSALAAGADHLAFGSVFGSSTKPGAVRASHALFGQARALGVPLVAIGGITPDNAREVIDAGADAIAVISALFDAPDIEAEARRFSALFKTH